MIQTPKRRTGAPPGNRNAATSPHGSIGLSVSLYLNGAERDILDRLLAERGEEATDATRRGVARELLRRAIRGIAPETD